MFAGYCMATFRPARYDSRRKRNDIFVVSLADFSPRQANSRRKLNSWKVAYRGENAKGRHAKTHQRVMLAGFRVATCRPARQRYDKQEAKRRHMKSVVLSCGGRKVAMRNTKKSPFGGFSRGTFMPFRPENTIIRHGTNQPPYYGACELHCHNLDNISKVTAICRILICVRCKCVHNHGGAVHIRFVVLILS